MTILGFPKPEIFIQLNWTSSNVNIALQIFLLL